MNNYLSVVIDQAQFAEFVHELAYARSRRADDPRRECRVTEWRKTQLDSPLGFDVIAYREWVPLQKHCWMPDPEQVPASLRHGGPAFR